MLFSEFIAAVVSKFAQTPSLMQLCAAGLSYRMSESNSSTAGTGVAVLDNVGGTHELNTADDGHPVEWSIQITAWFSSSTQAFQFVDRVKAAFTTSTISGMLLLIANEDVDNDGDQEWYGRVEYRVSAETV